MTDLYVCHDSVCVLWLYDLSIYVLWLCVQRLETNYLHDLSTCVLWLCICAMTLWLIYMCAMTHLYMTLWLIYMCAMTRLYMTLWFTYICTMTLCAKRREQATKHDPQQQCPDRGVPWHISMCAVSHPYACHGSSICVWRHVTGLSQVLLVSFAKETYKRDYILQKRPVLLIHMCALIH